MKWTDISENQRYQSLSPEDQQSVQQKYFDQFVAPNVQEDQRELIQARFFERLGSSQDSPQDKPGFISNAARSVGERTADLAGGTAQFASQGGSWLDRKFPLGGFTFDEAFGPRFHPGRKYQEFMEKHNGTDLLAKGAKALKDVDLGYVPEHTWEKVKDKFEKGELAGGMGEVVAYGMEQGIKSIPDMAGAVLSLPAYVMARSSEIGDERAKNKGKDGSDFVDTLEAAPAALGSAILERIPVKFALGKGNAEEVGKDALMYALTKAAKTAGQEAGTEAIQEGVIEYVGEKFGTEAQMSVAEAFDRAMAGAVAGGVYGGAMGAGGGILEYREAKPGERAEEAVVPDDIWAGKTETPNLEHKPDRMINMPDGTTMWESELQEMHQSGLGTESAGIYHPAYPKASPVEQQEEQVPGQLEYNPDRMISLPDGSTMMESEFNRYRNEFGQVGDSRHPAYPKSMAQVSDEIEADLETDRSIEEELSIAERELADLEARLARRPAPEPEVPVGLKYQQAQIEQPRLEPMASPNIETDLQPTQYGERVEWKPKQSREEPKNVGAIPKGLNDSRILRDVYRSNLQRLSDEIVRGGDISILPDGSRTKSINPKWFQELGVGVQEAKNAVQKALDGQKLGRRQASIVLGMMDEISDQKRNGTEEEIARRWQARHDAIGRADEQEISNFIERPSEHLKEVTPMEALVSEAVDEALKQGADVSEVESAITQFKDNEFGLVGYLKGIIPNANTTRGGAQESQALTKSGKSQESLDQEKSSGDNGGDRDFGADGIFDESQSIEGEESYRFLDELFGIEPESPVLDSYTANDLAARDQQAVEAEKLEAKRKQQAEAKAKADTEAKDFRLSGSDRPADIAAAAGQEDLLNSQNLKTSNIDVLAGEAATSPSNSLPEPSDAQKEAGNYKMAHIKVAGLDITIENPKGSKRSGTGPNGKSWEVELQHHYGYIKRTKGNDGDHVDVFIGPNPESEKVFVVDQINKDGSFDEHKVLIGFDSKMKAVTGYKSNYEKGWKVGPVTPMSSEELKSWLDSNDASKPVSESVKSLETKSKAQRQDMVASKSTTAAKPPSEPIEDFGEEIGGARKHEAYLDKLVQDVDVRSVPLSQSFPNPDYEKLASEGIDPKVLLLVAGMRSEIPSRPKKFSANSWADAVGVVRQMAHTLLSGSVSLDQVADKWESNKFYRPMKALIEFADRIDPKDLKKAGNWRISDKYFQLYHGQKNVSKWMAEELVNGRHKERGGFDTKEEAFKFIQKQLASENTVKTPLKFEIRGAKGKYYINKVGDKDYRALKVFDSVQSAREFLRDRHDDLVAEWEKVKAQFNVKKSDVRSSKNRPTKSKDYRKGKDITPEEFSEAFGFRGVQFGNWVKKGTNKTSNERQQSLNNAYDALMDLADILDIPTKAISLNGELGLAFGARGRGGNAAAHYEPDLIVINLTKTKGQGSLAHEWFHALDHHFQRQRGGEDGKKGQGRFITFKPEAMMVPKSGRHTPITKAELKRRSERFEGGLYDLKNWRKDPNHLEGVRPEVEKAFADLVARLNESPMAARSRSMDKKPDAYWSQIIERGARSFENYVIAKLKAEGRHNDYLANVTTLENFPRSETVYPYLLDEELGPIQEAFDELFAKLKTKVTDSGVMLYSRGKPDKSNKGLRVDEVESIAEKWFERFPGARKGLSVQIFSSAREAFGDQLSERDASRVKAGFDPDSNTVVFIASNLHSKSDVLETLQHEILAHQGLGFYPNEQIDLILQAVKSAISNDPQVSKIWTEVQKTYQDRPTHVQLEEVLARIAEKLNTSSWGKMWNDVLFAVRKALAKLGLVKPMIKLPELRKVLFDIADAFAEGKAVPYRQSSDTYFSREPAQDTDEALAKLGLSKESKGALRKKIDQLKNANLSAASEHFKQRAYEGVFDGLIGIKRAEDAVGAGIAAGDFENSGYVGARLATGVADNMHHVLHYGALKWDSGILRPVEGTRGLLDIVGDLGSDLNDWLAWMGGNRGEELMMQGRENNLTEEDIQALKSRSKGKEDKFNKAKKEYNAINKAMLDMAEGAGLIDPDSRQKWESDWYVPFYRRSESDGNAELLGPSSSRGLSHQSSGIRALKGGKLATNDLLENILTNWMKLVDSSVKNSALVKAVDNLKGSDFIKDESTRFQQVAISRSEIAARIKKDRKLLRSVANFLGMPEGSDAIKVAGELNKPENEEFEKMWAAVAPKDPDIIRVKRAGKNEYYRVEDQSLLRAVTHLGFEGFTDPVTKTGRWFKRLLTTGVTASPDFIIRNFIRDGVHAWTINPDGFKFAVDSFKGLRDAFKQDPVYKAMIAGGAAFQGGYVHGTDPQASAQIMRRATLEKGIKEIESDSLLDTPEKVWDVVQKYWQMYRNAGDKVENANRMAAFKAALKAGKPISQALYESKDLMDYSLRGNFQALMWLTDMVPFLNARLQGLSKLGRAVKEDPKSVGMKVAMIAGFSISLAALNADDDRYDELPDWEKDAYWHIFLGEDHYRIPKPFEIGVVAGTFPERLVHTTIGKQESEKLAWTVKHNILHTFGFEPIPQFALPVVEAWGNRSRFFDAPIEGMEDEGKLPESRYNSRTSDFMVKMGDWLGMSPKKLEHVWNGYTGIIGMYALSVIDMGTRGLTDNPENPAATLSDMPVIKSFYRGTQNKGSQYLTEFYDMLEVTEQTYKSIRSYREEGKIDEAEALMEKHKKELASRKQLLKVRKKLSRMRRAIERIELSDLSAKEKRDRIDQINLQKNEYVREAVRTLKSAYK